MKRTFPSSTLPSSRATIEARLRPPQDEASPGQAYQQLPDIAMYPLSSGITFLTALIRDFGDAATFSTSQAVTLLQSITHPPCDMADLPTRYTQLNKARHHVDQLEPALSGLPATRAGAAALQEPVMTMTNI